MSVPFPPPQPEEGQNPAEQVEEVNELPLNEPVAAEQPASPEASLPSEAQGEINGGPLGCCLGVTVGLVLSLIIAVISRLYGDPLFDLLHGNLSITVRLVMGLVAIAGAIFFGSVGWRIGKRIYREYELTPKQKEKLARLERRQLERLQRRR